VGVLTLLSIKSVTGVVTCLEVLSYEVTRCEMRIILECGLVNRGFD